MSDERKRKLLNDFLADPKPFMPRNDNQETELQEPSPILEEFLSWGKEIDFEKLGKNSVLVVKIGNVDPVYATKLQYAVVKQVLEPRRELLKEKQVTVLFMASDDDISVITEEDMAKSGWEKKEKSRIIIL